MTTQTKSKKNNSEFKAGLKIILVVGGTLLIPFYAIYFNTGSEEKLETLKSSKPVVKTMKMHIEQTDSQLAVNKIQKRLPEKLKQIDFNTKSFDEAYKYNLDTFGERSIFTWHGLEYLVDTYIKPIPPSKYDVLDYSDAFTDARSDLGACGEFNWRGNVYNACLVGESIETITEVQVKTEKLPIGLSVWMPLIIIFVFSSVGLIHANQK